MLAVLYISVGTYFWATQDQKIFAPLQLNAQTPGDLIPPLQFDEIEIPCGQSTVHGFWIPAVDRNAPVALYLHGQDATIGKNLEHAECLHQLGCSVLVIDYRGFGKTFGSMSPSEDSVYQDAEAAWEYLTKTGNLAANRILIYGHSLGGAIAIELATRHPEAGGLVAESGFTSISRVARWKFPITNSLPLDFLLRHHFDSIEKVRRMDLPSVLFFHGTADSKVPYSMCKELYDATKASDKDILLIPGGEHANHGPGEVAYRARLSEFIDCCFGTGKSGAVQQLDSE